MPVGAAGASPRGARPAGQSADALRTQLLARLPGPGFGPLLGLLDDAAPPPAVDTVDELVALAGALVEAPGGVGTDPLLLAVALYLRSLVDDGGWDDGDVDDVRAAADRLLAAADALSRPRPTPWRWRSGWPRCSIGSTQRARSATG